MSSNDKAVTRAPSVPPLRRNLMRRIQGLSEHLLTHTAGQMLLVDSSDLADPERLRKVYTEELDHYVAVAQAVPLWRARHAELASKRKENGARLKELFRGIDYAVSYEECVLLNSDHQKLMRKERDAFAIFDYLTALQDIYLKRLEACSNSIALRGQELREKWLTRK